VLRERSGGVGGRMDSSLQSAAMALQAHVLEASDVGRRHGRPPEAQGGGPLTADLAAVAADPALADRFEHVGGCTLPARPWRFSS
jgi:hypothetical protein